MNETEKRVITANKIMISYDKAKIQELKEEQATLSRNSDRHAELSAFIRELNQDISSLTAYNAEITLEG